MEVDVIVMLTITLIGLFIYTFLISYKSIERFCTYPTSIRTSIIEKVEDKHDLIENFGFENDKSVDIELVVSGLNDCNAIVGTGDGIRDMIDFSDRFITAQFEASNDIPIVENHPRECK